MLIGCGCHCGDATISEFPSGSFGAIPSEDSGNVTPSSQQPDPNVGYCGACYNAPSEWRVIVPTLDIGPWLTHAFPDLFHDCRSLYEGPFILRAYGVSAISPGPAIVIDPLNAGVVPCAVWQSDERAPFANRFNGLTGAATEPCALTNVPRWELTMHTPFADSSANAMVQFTLFYWWIQNGFFGLPTQIGYGFSWQVPAVWDGNTPVFQNCVRCFNADAFNINWVLSRIAYSNAHLPSVSVCPN